MGADSGADKEKMFGTLNIRHELGDHFPFNSRHINISISLVVKQTLTLTLAIILMYVLDTEYTA